MNNHKKLKDLCFRLLTSHKHRYQSSGTVPKKESKAHLFLLTIPVASFCLGTWQVKRLKWKKGLIRDLEIRSQSDPVNLPSDILEPGKLKEMEYKRVFVAGKFDHDKEIFLGPRSLNEGDSTRGGLGRQPIVGYHIVTPFVLDSGERILINRGWVPKEKKPASARTEGQITDRVTIAGHVRTGEKRPQFAPKVNENGFEWHYCDVDSFARLLHTKALLIDADASSSVTGGPIGGQTRVTLRNEHLQYIITWYSLSFATFLLYYQFRKQPGSMFRAGPTIRE